MRADRDLYRLVAAHRGVTDLMATTDDLARYAELAQIRRALDDAMDGLLGLEPSAAEVRAEDDRMWRRRGG